MFQIDYKNYTYTDDILIKIKNIGIGLLISLNVMGIKEVSKEELYEPENEEVKSFEVGGIMNLYK